MPDPGRVHDAIHGHRVLPFIQEADKSRGPLHRPWGRGEQLRGQFTRGRAKGESHARWRTPSQVGQTRGTHTHTHTHTHTNTHNNTHKHGQGQMLTYADTTHTLARACTTGPPWLQLLNQWSCLPAAAGARSRPHSLASLLGVLAVLCLAWSRTSVSKACAQNCAGKQHLTNLGACMRLYARHAWNDNNNALALG